MKQIVTISLLSLSFIFIGCNNNISAKEAKIWPAIESGNNSNSWNGNSWNNSDMKGFLNVAQKNQGKGYVTALDTVKRSGVDEKKSRKALPGQIIRDPNYPNKLVYNKDDNQDGQLDPLFISGPGDPEGFLYRGKRNPDGTRDGDQLKLINKLKKYGGNSVYFSAIRTHGGDAWKDKRDDPEIYPDDLHNPWIDQNPKNGLNDQLLDQWDTWFKEMDKNGIVIYFFIYDDAVNVAEQFGWSLDAEGNLNPEEKAFIQKLVNRFKHHKNLIWCVMEEGQEIGENWQLHISKLAEAIQEADNYNHIIATHQLNGNKFFHKNNPAITQFAIQTNEDKVGTTDSLHQWMLKARDYSNGTYSLVMSEDGIHGNRSVPNGDREEIRKRNWAAAMADAYVMVYGMLIDDTPKSWLKDCKTLQTFFEATTFNQMFPNDSLAFGETSYLLANKGYDYILYSANVENNLGLKNLTEGTYALNWVDAADGTRKAIKKMDIKRGNHTWKKPSGFGNEVALYIQREDKRPEIKKPSVTEDQNLERDQSTNTAPVGENYTLKIPRNKSKDIYLKYIDEDGGPGPYSIEIIDEPKNGTLTGVGNDKIYTPDSGYTGEDQFSWKVNDGKDDSNIATIKLIVK